MSIEQQRENISNHIYAQHYNMYLPKTCCQEFWYILSGLDIRLEQAENW